ncbi:MAG: hypothetical protein HEP71_14850 [Roseivirga sp.]|nr:hypothetical protein [Roseivirga sp.]
MKSPNHFLKAAFLLLAVFSLSAANCDQKSRKFMEKGKITLSPKEIVNINGRLEFSATMDYNTEDIKSSDSLEVRFYLYNSQIETLLGSFKDSALATEPLTRKRTETFKTTWFSKVPITNIEIETVLYKNGKQKTLPRVTVGTIVSKPADRP